MESSACLSPVVAALPREARRRLLISAVWRRLDAGELLLLSGSDRRRAYIVVHGVVKLTARDGEGRETILGLARPGDVVGDIAALDGFCHPLDAIAATRVRALGINADLLVETLGQHARASLALARSLAIKTRWTYETALERTSGDISARLAGRLLHLAELLGSAGWGRAAASGAGRNSHGSAGCGRADASGVGRDSLGRARPRSVDVELPLFQEDLARFAGMCRESACRTLKHFKAQGWIDYRRQTLRILQPDALERIRCAGRAGGPYR